MSRNTEPVRLAGPLLVRRFLADYARNPVNLLILVLVPVGFVAGAAGSMAQLAKLLSGTAAPGTATQTVTAGWAAAFIAAIAAYFQVQDQQVDRVAGVVSEEPAHQQGPGQPRADRIAPHFFSSLACPSRRVTMRSNRCASVTKWLMIRTDRPASRRSATSSQNFR